MPVFFPGTGVTTRVRSRRVWSAATDGSSDGADPGRAHDARGGVEPGPAAGRGVPVAGYGPVELGRPGQLHRGAGREVEDQYRRGRVDGQVARAVEHVVARVVRPAQARGV